MQDNLNVILNEIEIREEFEISEYATLTGGSINQVFLLTTSAGQKVLKVNVAERFPRMFEAEKEGLEALQKSKTIDVPEVLSLGQIDSTAYLLLEHIPEGRETSSFWSLFAENLAGLHKVSAKHFGFDSDNYIGSLPQYNSKEYSASDFYIKQRLEPQFKMASEGGFSFDGLDTIYKNIASEIPKEPPSLIHGDLWSGNYLINEQGLPCLIDPAVCYSPREMDLAMMKLFGGFSDEVFRQYEELFPLEPGFQQRIPLWQLYYLLVHLNIFGGSYLSRVQVILKSYS